MDTGKGGKGGVGVLMHGGKKAGFATNVSRFISGRNQAHMLDAHMASPARTMLVPGREVLVTPSVSVGTAWMRNASIRTIAASASDSARMALGKTTSGKRRILKRESVVNASVAARRPTIISYAAKMTHAVVGGVPNTMVMLMVLMIAFFVMNLSSRLRMVLISFSKNCSLFQQQSRGQKAESETRSVGCSTTRISAACRPRAWQRQAPRCVAAARCLEAGLQASSHPEGCAHRTQASKPVPHQA